MIMDNDKLNNPAPAETPTNAVPNEPPANNLTSADPFGSVGFEAEPSGQPIPEPEPEPVPVPTPTVATPKEKFSKKTVILIVILVLLIIGVAVGAILIFKPFDQKKSTKKDPSTSKETPANPGQGETIEGDEVKDEATLSSLKSKANTILSVGALTDDSDSIMTDTYYVSSRALQIMSDSEKLALLLDFKSATEATPKQINDMADETYEAFGFKGRNEVLGLYFVPYKAAYKDGLRLTFGTDEINFPTTLVSARSDYDFIYDEPFKGFFVKPKESPGSKSFYIYSVTAKDNKAYVYVAAGSSVNDTAEDGTIDYENGTDYYDYDCTKKASSFRMMITEVNYKDYEHFRLVFNKGADYEGSDNYTFEKLEKL